MGLKLKLRPGERCVINGAVVENGGGRTTLTVQNFAQVMRSRSIMQEAEAETPAKRVYFAIQAMLLDGANAERHRRNYNTLMSQLYGAMRHPDVQDTLREVIIHVDDEDYYRALMSLRPVIEHEAQVLARMAEAEAPGDAATPRAMGDPAHGRDTTSDPENADPAGLR
jgi:flagellar protein FlbT